MENLSILQNQDPLQIFKNWLKEAKQHPDIKEPTAMVLSTIKYGLSANDFTVSSRVVLLKEVQNGELIFFTNYQSAKAYQIKYGVGLNFYWPALGRQVRMEGVALKTTRDISVQYWDTRPRESQISQYISEQSKKLKNREVLEKKRQEAEKKFYGKKIPCPQHWGGYGFTPHLIEFWSENPHRLHNRLVFEQKWLAMFSKKKWQTYLLYP